MKSAKEKRLLENLNQWIETEDLKQIRKFIKKEYEWIKSWRAEEIKILWLKLWIRKNEVKNKEEIESVMDEISKIQENNNWEEWTKEKTSGLIKINSIELLTDRQKLTSMAEVRFEFGEEVSLMSLGVMCYGENQERDQWTRNQVEEWYKRNGPLWTALTKESENRPWQEISWKNLFKGNLWVSAYCKKNKNAINLLRASKRELISMWIFMFFKEKRKLGRTYEYNGEEIIKPINWDNSWIDSVKTKINKNGEEELFVSSLLYASWYLRNERQVKDLLGLVIKQYPNLMLGQEEYENFIKEINRIEIEPELKMEYESYAERLYLNGWKSEKKEPGLSGSKRL